MLRTRSDASALVEAGHVRVNGARVTAPGHLVRPDDVVTLALDRTVRVVAVAGFAARRGNATAAQLLYRDLTVRPGHAGSPES